MNLLASENYDDDDDDLLSSSEDEGVDLDDEDSEDDSDNPINTRLLHQLAASLTQELKFSQTQISLSCKAPQSSHNYQANETPQHMEVAHEINYQAENYDVKFDNYTEHKNNSNFIQNNQTSDCIDFVSNKRCRLDQYCHSMKQEENNVGEDSSISSSWGVGWDDCTAEAVKYLTDIEGLSPQHPIVLSLKNHLQLKREMAVAQLTL